MTATTEPLTVAPCSYQAARYAVMRWHYSHRMPAGKLVLLGVWEFGRFVGAVTFGRGAAPRLGVRYNLTQTECVELVRVALREHAAPVSQIVARALGVLHDTNPGLRLVVSFADPNEGHHGGIYQAGNWIYTGCSDAAWEYVDKAGRRWKQRQVTASGWVTEFGKYKRAPKAGDCTRVRVPGKHRYLMPLDKATRRRVSKLAQPYPHAVEASTVTRPVSDRESQVQLLANAPTPRGDTDG